MKNKVYAAVSIFVIIVWVVLSTLTLKHHLDYRNAYTSSITEVRILTNYIKTHETELKKTPDLYDDLNLNLISKIDESKNALSGTNKTLALLFIVTFVAGVVVVIPYAWDSTR